MGYEDENLGVYGVIVLSRTETYYNIGTSRVNVKNMELYIKENEENKTINQVEEAMITTRNNIGYSYVKYDNIDNLINNIYLKVITQENKEYDVQLTIHKFSENSNLLFFNKEETIDDTNESSNLIVPEKIKKEFRLEDDTYKLKKTIENKIVTFHYYIKTNVFEVLEEKENDYVIWKYHLDKKYIQYEKSENKKLVESTVIDNLEDTRVKFFIENYYSTYFN